MPSEIETPELLLRESAEDWSVATLLAEGLTELDEGLVETEETEAEARTFPAAMADVQQALPALAGTPQ